MKIRIAIFLLAALAVMKVAASSARSDERPEFFAAKIHPLVKTYCVACHSTKEKKGGLDMQRFATLRQVRSDIELWEAVLEMLDTGQMPPKGKPQPRPEERRLIAKWLRDLLEREATRRAELERVCRSRLSEVHREGQTETGRSG